MAKVSFGGPEMAADVAEQVLDKAKQVEVLNYDVNRFTARVLELEKELRQARADERRSRAALFQVSKTL